MSASPFEMFNEPLDFEALRETIRLADERDQALAKPVKPSLRFHRGKTCPVCGGSDDAARGVGERCHGYLSPDKKFAYCTREECAGDLEPIGASGDLYRHVLAGSCPCHTPHEPKPRLHVVPPGPIGTIDSVYRYNDEAGNLLYEVVRYRDPKGFRIRRPDPADMSPGNTSRIRDLNGTRRILYRLYDLHKRGPFERVYICEGEKDADTISDKKLPAVTNVCGAGKWHDDYTAQLIKAGVKEAIVLRHEDAQGLAHQQAVAESCHRAGLSVRCVALPDLEPDSGQDVSVWLDDLHTADELAEIVAATPLWTPPKPASRKHRLVVEEGTAIKRRRIDWLWPGRLARGVPTLLIGDPDLGKGLTLADLTARITTGQRWSDEPEDAPLRAPGHVIILSAEDPADIVLEPRLFAAGADPRFYTVVNGVLGKDDEERGLSIEIDMAELDALVEEKQSVAILIDPLNAYIGATDRNSDNKVRSSLKPMVRMIEKRNMAAIALMHLGKDSDRAAMYRSLGSIGFTAAARASFCVARDPADPESLRRLFLPVKFNIGPKPPGLVFQVTPTAVPALDEGEPITTAKIEWLPETTIVKADEALGQTTPGRAADKETQDEEAELFLDQALGSGPVLVEVLRTEAKDRKISLRALDRAKKAMGVKYRKIGLGGQWECYLAPDPDSAGGA